MEYPPSYKEQREPLDSPPNPNEFSKINRKEPPFNPPSFGRVGAVDFEKYEKKEGFTLKKQQNLFLP